MQLIVNPTLKKNREVILSVKLKLICTCTAMLRDRAAVISNLNVIASSCQIIDIVGASIATIRQKNPQVGRYKPLNHKRRREVKTLLELFLVLYSVKL